MQASCSKCLATQSRTWRVQSFSLTQRNMHVHAPMSFELRAVLFLPTGFFGSASRVLSRANLVLMGFRIFILYRFSLCARLKFSHLPRVLFVGITALGIGLQPRRSAASDIYHTHLMWIRPPSLTRILSEISA